MAEAALREHRWTREEWRRLVESGALGKARLELRHGRIVEKMNIGSRHAQVVSALSRHLTIGLEGTGLQVRGQNPIALGDDDEPQPDIAVVIDRDYFDDHPAAADVALVIEVADSTLAADRAHIHDYAAAGIAEAWIVNIGARAVEVYATPTEGRYRDTVVHTAGALDALGVTVDLATLFPPR